VFAGVQLEVNMWYLMDELANQREREITARTRAPLFTRQSLAEQQRLTRQDQRSASHARADRGQKGWVKLPALSLGKWRHWSAGPDAVHCSRAASITGAC
jgi:hypothetical protein